MFAWLIDVKKRIHVNVNISEKIALARLSLLHPTHFFNQIIIDSFADNGILFVIRMRDDEVPQIMGVGHQLTGCPHSNQPEVVGQSAGRGRAHLLIPEVILHQGQQAQVPQLIIPVDDLVDGHFHDIGVLVVLAGGGDVPPEVELLPEHSVHPLSPVHVGVHLGNGDEEVVVEAEDGSGQQHQEHRGGRVLELVHLQLAGPELDPPADLRVGRRRFEPHGVPVGRLDVLEVVSVLGVVLLDLFAEERHGFADEEMGHVFGQTLFDAVVLEHGVDGGVVGQRDVVVVVLVAAV